MMPSRRTVRGTHTDSHTKRGPTCERARRRPPIGELTAGSRVLSHAACHLSSGPLCTIDRLIDGPNSDAAIVSANLRRSQTSRSRAGRSVWSRTLAVWVVIDHPHRSVRYLCLCIGCIGEAIVRNVRPVKRSVRFGSVQFGSGAACRRVRPLHSTPLCRISRSPRRRSHATRFGAHTISQRRPGHRGHAWRHRRGAMDRSTNAPSSSAQLTSAR
jgi:hypothetical protein